MAEILVVDDEMGIRELLSEILGDEGHSVTLADNAQRAREAMQANKVDLVLLDIWMPDRAMPSFQPSQANSIPLSMLQVPGPQNSSHMIPLSSPTAQFMAAPAGGIPTQHLHPSIMARDLPLDVPLREAREAFERAYFEHHLHREHGSMTRVAERTGLERTHLYRKLKQLGIDLSKGNYRRGASQSL